MEKFTQSMLQIFLKILAEDSVIVHSRGCLGNILGIRTRSNPGKSRTPTSKSFLIAILKILSVWRVKKTLSNQQSPKKGFHKAKHTILGLKYLKHFFYLIIFFKTVQLQEKKMVKFLIFKNISIQHTITCCTQHPRNNLINFLKKCLLIY